MDIRRCGENQKPCPLDTALQVGSETVKRLGSAHASPVKTLGANFLLQHALCQIAETLGCDGSVSDQNGQIICPLGDAARSARSFGTGTLQPNSFALTDLGQAPELLGGRRTNAPINNDQPSGYL